MNNRISSAASTSKDKFAHVKIGEMKVEESKEGQYIAEEV